MKCFMCSPIDYLTVMAPRVAGLNNAEATKLIFEKFLFRKLVFEMCRLLYLRRIIVYKNIVIGVVGENENSHSFLCTTKHPK